jgi:hypothetical protein
MRFLDVLQPLIDSLLLVLNQTLDSKLLKITPTPAGKNILSDETIELTSLKGEKCGYYLGK